MGVVVWGCFVFNFSMLWPAHVWGVNACWD